MLAAGIQTDEAVSLLGENMEDGSFKRACNAVYARLIAGIALAPCKAPVVFRSVVVAVGEVSGRLEPTLRVGRLLRRRRASVLENVEHRAPRRLALRDRHLAFTVAVILPVFVNMQSLASGLAAGSFNAVGVAIGIGWALSHHHARARCSC